jgi:hypothetical protein
MSVVFTTISDKFIAMCADKQEKSAPKIEKWASHIAVGMSGDMTAGEYIRSSVHQFVAESGIKTVQDIRALKQAGVDAVLIGETMMLAADKAKKLEELNG